MRNHDPFFHIILSLGNVSSSGIFWSVLERANGSTQSVIILSVHIPRRERQELKQKVNTRAQNVHVLESHELSISADVKPNREHHKHAPHPRAAEKESSKSSLPGAQGGIPRYLPGNCQ